MNKKIIISKTTQDDVAEIFEIELACFGEAEATVRESFEQIVNLEENYFFYSLRYSGKLVGFYCAILDEKEAHLADLALNPDFQNKGLGSLLLDHCLKILREKNCRILVLTVRRGNLPAIRLYNKKGFTELGILTSYYGDEDGIRLQYVF